jgi:hypothetical protein
MTTISRSWCRDSFVELRGDCGYEQCRLNHDTLEPLRCGGEGVIDQHYPVLYRDSKAHPRQTPEYFPVIRHVFFIFSA